MAKLSFFTCEGCQQQFHSSDAKYNHKRKNPACLRKKGQPGRVSTPQEKIDNKIARLERRDAKRREEKELKERR